MIDFCTYARRTGWFWLYLRWQRVTAAGMTRTQSAARTRDFLLLQLGKQGAPFQIRSPLNAYEFICALSSVRKKVQHTFISFKHKEMLCFSHAKSNKHHPEQCVIMCRDYLYSFELVSQKLCTGNYLKNNVKVSCPQDKLTDVRGLWKCFQNHHIAFMFISNLLANFQLGLKSELSVEST